MLDFTDPAVLCPPDPGDSDDRRRLPQPGELWSLCDMIELLAGDICKSLGDVKVFEALLLEFIDQHEKNGTSDMLVLDGFYARSLDSLIAQCERIGLHMTVKPLQAAAHQFTEAYYHDAENTIRMGISPVEMFYELISDGLRRFEDETRELRFLVVEPSRIELYRQKEPLFGKAVAKRFPSLIGEVTEIGKCLALGRPTASAFHSIRSMEAGIRAMSRCLAIPDPTKGSERSWFKMLEKIDAGIKARWPTSGDRMTGDGQTFEELYGALSGMQNPYRNATAHLDRDYNDDEARHVMELCRGFLTRIAKRMDESGMPLA